MISEVTDGVILDYIPDALGSIHSVIDQDANVVKTMRYKPYGEVLSRSGTVADRHYQWVGSYGYRATFAPSSSHYVRARHYSATAGSWTTVDPLWPDESAYGYVGGHATIATDPSGKGPNHSCFTWIPGQPGRREWVGPGCNDYMVMGDSPGYWQPTGPCKKMCDQLSRCSQTFDCDALRENLGGGPGGAGEDCCAIASKFGISPNCFCAIASTERSYQNRFGGLNSLTEPIPPIIIKDKNIFPGDTLGCMQLSVESAKGYLESFKKCSPSKFGSIFPGYPYSDARLKNLLLHDCSFSMKVVAAFTAANTPPCSPGSCKNAGKLFNGVNPRTGAVTNPKWQTLFDCVRSAFENAKPCG